MARIYERVTEAFLRELVGSESFKKKLLEASQACQQHRAETGFSIVKKAGSHEVCYTDILVGKKNAISTKKYNDAIEGIYINDLLLDHSNPSSEPYEFLRFHFHYPSSHLRPSADDLRIYARMPGIASSRTEVAPIMAVGRAQNVHKTGSPFIDILLFQRKRRYSPEDASSIHANIMQACGRAYIKHAITGSKDGVFSLLDPSASVDPIYDLLATRDSVSQFGLFESALIQIHGSELKVDWKEIGRFAR